LVSKLRQLKQNRSPLRDPKAFSVTWNLNVQS
jgi:hypothetical protein